LTTYYYDVVVMGMELGPLVAGALLAKRGFRVLVVGQNGARDRYPCLGYQFALRPFALTGTESPVFTRVVDELGLPQLMGLSVSFPEPAFQLIGPRVRVDVSHTVSKTREEVRRELPEDEPCFEGAIGSIGRISGEVEKLLSRDFVLPPESFFEKREYARVDVQNPFRGPAFLLSKLEGAALPEVFELPLRFETAGASPLHPLIRYRLLGNWLFDCGTITGGRDRLRELLVDQVVGQGGDAQPRQQIMEIVVSRGKVSGVSVAGRKETVGCQVILTSLTPKELAPYMSPSAWTKGFRSQLAACPEAVRGYALNLGIEREGMPEGLARTAFVSGGSGLGDELLRVEQIPQDDDKKAALHVACIVPKGKEGSIESGALRDAVLDRMRRLVPFLDHHLAVIHSPFDGFGPIDLKGDAKGEPPPVPHPEEVPRWLLRPPPESGLLGVGNLPHRTGIKGLLLSGDQVVSGLGLEGELIAAWGAARIAGKMDPRRERLLRSMRAKVEI
jgi:phytoene dehydrogenase-like protein